LIVIVGFIPILAPLALILGAWLLAYQFIDVVLDVFRISLSKRIKFALQNWLPVTLFGTTLIIVCSIPFVAILIPPVAVAGSAWLIGETAWGKSQLKIWAGQSPHILQLDEL
jgi:uncharacterized protein involved in cysteine biosynthesis